MLRLLMIFLFFAYVCCETTTKCRAKALARSTRPKPPLTTTSATTTLETIIQSLEIPELGISSNSSNEKDCFAELEAQLSKWSNDSKQNIENLYHEYKIGNQTNGTLGKFLCDRLGNDFYGILQFKATFESKTSTSTRTRNKFFQIPIDVKCKEENEFPARPTTNHTSTNSSQTTISSSQMPTTTKLSQATTTSQTTKKPTT